MNNNQYINRIEAAALIGMPISNFDYYLRKNRVPGTEIIAGKLIFNKDVLKKWNPQDKRKGNKGRPINHQPKEQAHD